MPTSSTFFTVAALCRGEQNGLLAQPPTLKFLTQTTDETAHNQALKPPGLVGTLPGVINKFSALMETLFSVRSYVLATRLKLKLFDNE